MSLWRRALSEFIGTAFLVAGVVGSGIAAERRSADPGLQLLENSAATGALLVALILALGPVSAAFNPVVTLAERLLGRVSTREAAALAGTQILGGAVGAIAANLMFALDGVTWSTQHRDGAELVLAEVVASFGLVLIVLGTVLSGRVEHVALAVGGYIAAAYWFTSSTSFANPAVTIARTLSDTFAGIAPASVGWFLLAQIVGTGIAVLAFRALHSARPPVPGDAVPSPSGTETPR